MARVCDGVGRAERGGGGGGGGGGGSGRGEDKDNVNVVLSAQRASSSPVDVNKFVFVTRA